MQQRDRHPLDSYWITVALVLVIVALLGSVVIPGMESADALTSLREDSEYIEPAHVASEEIEAGVARVYTELQRYAITHDTASPGRLNRIAAQNEANIAKLRQFTGEIRDGDSAVKDVQVLARQLEQLHSLASMGTEVARPPVAADAIERRLAIRESLLVATNQVQSDLSRIVAEHRDAVVLRERRGFLVNAALVLAALLGMVSMLKATERERRRARRDSALRVAAESFVEKRSTGDVARQIAQSAIDVSHGESAVMLRIEGLSGNSPRTVVSALAGESDALTRFAGAYRGSIVERTIELGQPQTLEIELDGRSTQLLIVPLGTAQSPSGAVLVALSSTRRFRYDEPVGATFGRLAQLAYEKVQLLEDATAARSQLERAIESRGRLLRGFSHDVKNPLGAADGYAALIEADVFGPITDEQRRSIGRLRTAMHHALSLIEDLHKLARVESGGLAVRLGRTDLQQLVLNLGDEYRATAEARNLKLIVDVESDLPTVVTDASRVRQVVANLLSNAIKYTDAGSVTLRASRQESGDAQHQSILILVADTGPGIPADKLDSIFEEFSRLSDKQPGAGVGLAISRHLANAIGCTLGVTSEVGKGSAFTLSIPLRVEREEFAPAERELAAHGRGGDGPVPGRAD